jgi:hypothetical protein
MQSRGIPAAGTIAIQMDRRWQCRASRNACHSTLNDCVVADHCRTKPLLLLRLEACRPLPEPALFDLLGLDWTW